MGAGARPGLQLGAAAGLTEIDLAATPLRELNAALHAIDDTSPRHWRVLNPRGAHALAVGIDAPVEVEIDDGGARHRAHAATGARPQA